MQNISILGATGSIGQSTLDVIGRHRDRYRVFALTANTSEAALAALCREYRPRYAVIADESRAAALKDLLRRDGSDTDVLSGPDGLVRCVIEPEVDTVMAAIVGAAGLVPTLAAAKAGKKVLLANKEALVMAGPIFMEAVRQNGATLLPIDSEHNAIFQCLPDQYRGALDAQGIRRILLTGSGGPFLKRPLDTLDSVTPDEACAHPNWVMGRKISVDSATMMNKALEIIEAHWLFNAPADRIGVVIHPQSVIHSMVEYVDGSVIAQLGNPDMRTPIAQALAHPGRIDAGVASLDFFKLGELRFAEPDFARFPSLRLAYTVLGQGGTASAVLNAANEVAVAAFLAGNLAFTRIVTTIAEVLERVAPVKILRLEDVLEADTRARESAREVIGRVAIQ